MGQRDGDAGRAGRDVEHAGGLMAGDVADELVAPAGVLAERKHLGEAVVARRQVPKEAGREGVLATRRRWLAHESGAYGRSPGRAS